MTQLIAEFQTLFNQGGFAIWGLVFISVLLYTNLARISLRLIKLAPIRHGKLPVQLQADLYAARNRDQIIHLASNFELEQLGFVQRRLPFAAILTGTAPLVGLLGTVSGMLATFAGLATASAAQPIEKISSGVSEALITTQTGLVIAIPAAILTALLHSQAKATEDSIQSHMHQFLSRCPAFISGLAR